MNLLHPTLWRTCRVLANPVRLRVLRHVADQGETNVSEAARTCHLPLSSTTAALRALQARGLLGVRREGLFVVYVAHADDSVEHAPAILSAVQQSFRRRDSMEEIVRAATAFTHVRRILIAQALAAKPVDAATLSVVCGISKPALYRHLDKLMRRGVVATDGQDRWRLIPPDSPLLRELVALVSAGRAPGAA
jgi:DNA-binding transcriptional ArsR family regulator